MAKRKRDFQVHSLEYDIDNDSVESEFSSSEKTINQAKKSLKRDIENGVIYEVDNVKKRHRELCNSWNNESEVVCRRSRWRKGIP